MTTSFSEDGKTAWFKSNNTSEGIMVSLWNWDIITDKFVLVEEFRIPASKGNDVIQISLTGNSHIVERDLTIDDLTFEQGTDKNGKLTKDLIIKYNFEEIKETGTWLNFTFIHDREQREQRIVLQNYFTSTAGTSTSLSYSIQFSGDFEDPNRYNIKDIYQHTLKPTKNTIGTVFGDVVDSSKNNETFTLKQGHNVINFNAQEGFGSDTVVLTKGETLNLNIKDTEGNYISDKDIKYSKSGNDLLITATVDGKASTIKVKDYIKTTSGATLKINNCEFSETLEVTATGSKKDTFTGSRLNEFAKSTDKNETFNLGSGENEIIFSSDDIGSDKIKLSNNEYLLLTGLKGNLSFKKKGNDITIIDSEKSGSITVNDFLKDKATVTVTDRDYLINLINNSNSDFLTYGDKNRLTAKKAVNLTGTILDETFYGSAKNDVIKAGKGTDVLIGGEGSDKLYGGEGSNTYEFYKKDGNDTVYVAKNAENIIHYNDTAKNTKYTAKGNDVVITKEYYDFPIDETHVRAGNKIYDITDLVGQVKKPKKGKYTKIDGLYYETSKLKSETIITDTVTVKDYLKGGYDVTVNGSDLTEEVNTYLADYCNGRVLGNAKSTNAQTIKGTVLNENIYGGKKADKIYTGKGADDVYAGGGNDTIYLNGEGEKTVYINKNDGNDVIYMNYDGVDANIRFDFSEEETAENPSQPTLKFKRTGNDLIISRLYSDEITKKNPNGLMGTTTIKNYFNNPTDSILRINDTEFSPNYNSNTQITFDRTGLKEEHFTSNDGDVSDEIFKNYNWYVDYKYDENGHLINPDAVLCKNFDWEIYGTKTDWDFITLGSGNDRVYEKAGSRNNIISDNISDDYYDFTNAGGWISDSGGDDTYSVTGMNKALFIIDYEGDDTLNIYNTSADKGEQLTFLFNVDNTGNIIECSADAENGYYDENSKALFIFNKANTDKLLKDGDPTGFIYIRDYFKQYEEIGAWNTETGKNDKITVTPNKIEHITQTIQNKDGTTTTYDIHIDSYINSIRSNVAGWLLEHTEYNDAMDVLDRGSKPEIAELIKYYQVDYTQEYTGPTN